MRFFCRGRRRALSLILASSLLTASTAALADGLDPLRAGARSAAEKQDYALAVANLRRARQSVLAANSEAAIRGELSRAELGWLRALITRTKSSEPSTRLAQLLAIRAEARRIENEDAEAEADRGLDECALEMWRRGADDDDAQTLDLGRRLQGSLARGSAVDALVKARERSVEEKLSRFDVRSVDGDYVRDRLRYFYGLRASEPADPRPVPLGLTVEAWPNEAGAVQTLSVALRGALASKNGSAVVRVKMQRVTGKLRREAGVVTKRFPFTETYSVPRSERIVNTRMETRTRTVPTKTCSPTYTTTTRTPTKDGYIQHYMQDGENCWNSTSSVDEQVEVETVTYREHTDVATRSVVETVEARTRTSELEYAATGTLRVSGTEVEISLRDRVSKEEEAYTSIHGGSASFSADIETTLQTDAAARAASRIVGLAQRAVRSARVDVIASELLALPAVVQRDALLAELSVLEAAPSPEVVARIQSLSTLPTRAIETALRGGRASSTPRFEASAPAFLALPSPDKDAEREAFVDEDREYIRRQVQQYSGGLHLGAGSIQQQGGPPFPYASLNVNVNATPAFLLYRTFVASGFVDGSLGLGKAIPVALVVGATAGVRVGPLSLVALGVGGGDTVFINREDDATSPNEPEVRIAPLLGYGARASLKTEAVNIVLSARRNHRFVQVPPDSAMGEARIGHSVFYLTGRYETFRDIFAGAPVDPIPWSFTGTIGLQYDFGDTEAGTLTKR